MKLILSIIVEIAFVVILFRRVSSFYREYKYKIDNTARYYGYRDYNDLKRLGTKEEERFVRKKIKKIRRRRNGRYRR